MRQLTSKEINRLLIALVGVLVLGLCVSMISGGDEDMDKEHFLLIGAEESITAVDSGQVVPAKVDTLHDYNTILVTSYHLSAGGGVRTCEFTIVVNGQTVPVTYPLFREDNGVPIIRVPARVGVWEGNPEFRLVEEKSDIPVRLGLDLLKEVHAIIDVRGKNLLSRLH